MVSARTACRNGICTYLTLTYCLWTSDSSSEPRGDRPDIFAKIIETSTEFRNVMTPLADLDLHKSLHGTFLQTSRLACPILNYIIFKLTGAHLDLNIKTDLKLDFFYPNFRISDGPLTVLFAQAAEQPADAR